MPKLFEKIEYEREETNNKKQKSADKAKSRSLRCDRLF